MSDNEMRKSWTAACVEALNQNDSWTGRMHIHKLMFVLLAVRKEDVPFEFELYQYGPYSFELDRTIAEMEMYGELGKSFPAAGYGPSYRLPELHEEFGNILPAQLKAIQSTARIVGALDSRELELVATALWVTEIEGIGDDQEIIDRVGTIKPKYSPQDIQIHLIKSREVKRALMAI